MATLFDEKIFNPEAFGQYVKTIPNDRFNRLISSKAIRANSEFNTLFSTQNGSFYATIPMFGRIGGVAQNYDGTKHIETNTTDTYSQGIVVVGRTNSWTEKDFSYDITSGTSFMTEIGKQLVEYWAEIDQDTILNTLQGVFSMNANAADTTFVSEHTYDATAIGTGLVDATTLNTALQKASGDQKNKYSLIIMPSIVATNLENLNLLSYLKYTDSSGVQRDLTMGTWNGRLVIVDDSMPIDTSGTDPIYTMYALGDGAIQYADIGAKIPYEMARDAFKTGGVTSLISRQRKVFSPYGISFTKASVATNSPSDDELKNGANWELVNNGQAGAKRKAISHKAIPIARILCKG